LSVDLLLAGRGEKGWGGPRANILSEKRDGQSKPVPRIGTGGLQNGGADG